MDTKESLQRQLAELESQMMPIKDKLNKIYQQEHDDVEAKVKRCRSMSDKFTLDDLVFSAGARCACGAGLAYPKNIGVHGAWYCSDILLGRAIPAGNEGTKEHDSSYPFAFYEIKSENQPSANGLTTRPAE